MTSCCCAYPVTFRCESQVRRCFLVGKSLFPHLSVPGRKTLAGLSLQDPDPHVLVAAPVWVVAMIHLPRRPAGTLRDEHYPQLQHSRATPEFPLCAHGCETCRGDHRRARAATSRTTLEVPLLTAIARRKDGNTSTRSARRDRGVRPASDRRASTAARRCRDAGDPVLARSQRRTARSPSGGG
jgi:hypothetical protein